MSNLSSDSALLTEWAYARDKPLLRGVLRAEPEHFQVDEELAFDIDGEGEHVYLHIEKRCLSTLAVRDRIRRLCHCRPVDIGYAGLKDKQALTRQWFSVYLPGAADVDWQQLAFDDVSGSGARLKVLSVQRHQRKLRRGVHAGNRFVLRVTDLAGSDEKLQSAVELIGQQGVPNYFGKQRFGNGGANADKVYSLFASNDHGQAAMRRMSRDKRSMLLSTARSLLFNWLLSQRVADGSWNTCIEGDRLMLNGTHSHFAPGVDDDSEDIRRRLQQRDLHVCGPLWGTDTQPSATEWQVAERFPELVSGLQANGVKEGRRAFRVLPQALQWQRDSEQLQVEFFLPPGSYATIVLRELVECGG